MKHDGICNKCGTHGPANSEEPMAKDAAKDLLLDKNGNYCGDHRACFLDKIGADNDTRATKNFIKVQNEIIGDAADDMKAYHVMMSALKQTFLIKRWFMQKSAVGTQATTWFVLMYPQCAAMEHDLNQLDWT